MYCEATYYFEGNEGLGKIYVMHHGVGYAFSMLFTP
jgi:hypothetical protein